MQPKVTLGRTGIEVTRLGFGALELRATIENGARLPNEEHAGRVLDAVLDAGINFIDTAPGYGRSEEYLGRRGISTKKCRFLMDALKGRIRGNKALVQEINACNIGIELTDTNSGSTSN